MLLWQLFCLLHIVLPFVKNGGVIMRNVFFSFHYKDIVRVSQIRNHYVTKPDRKSAGYLDWADWEQVKRQGDANIKRWINNQLNGTTVTAVLIGIETHQRPWVQYEIEESFKRGNGLLGIYLNNMPDFQGRSSWMPGANPFDKVNVKGFWGNNPLSNIVTTYDWINNDGYNNFANWVEVAAKNAGR